MQKWGGVRKSAVRLRTARQHRMYKSILTLPGEAIADIEVFDKQGVIDSNTYICMVERDKKTADVIWRSYRRKFANKFPNYDLVKGELVDFQTDIAFDFLNLDLMQSLNKDLLQWLPSITLLPNADLSLNLTVPRRNGDFYERMEEFFLHGGEGTKFFYKIRDKFNLHNQKTLSTKDFVNIAAVFAAMQSRYNLSILPKEVGDTYADHVLTMHFYRFWGINSAQENRPVIGGFQRLLQGNSSVFSHCSIHVQHERSCEPNSEKSIARCWYDAKKSGNPGELSYARRRLNLHLEAVKMNGKDPKRANAAFKAHVTRLIKQETAL